MMSCAAKSKSWPPVAAPASEPVSAPASQPVGFFSAQQMREVIAGCKLAIGDERAKSGACEARVRGLSDRVVQLTDIAHKLNMWTWLGPLVAGTLGLVLGGGLGAALGFGLRLVRP